MACFLVPAAQAVFVSAVNKIVKSREGEADEAVAELDGGRTEKVAKVSFSRKLKWLSNLLWGGCALLSFEHFWHGEIVPVFPFLTAASNPADAVRMLNEMATVGVTMSALVTAVWVLMCAAVSVMERKIFSK